MIDPSSEEECILREWAPLDTLLQQIPVKDESGLSTGDVSLTCVDAVLDFIAVGTNLGLVYWFNRRTGDLQSLHFESSTSAIRRVKVVSAVDYMVAAGNDLGVVTVFQIPKDLSDNLPESMKLKNKEQIERYTIAGLHSSPVTAIEWSLNGMQLFSGDRNGFVVLSEIDFYTHLSKSVELFRETCEIIQLSYSQQLLLVSTLYRSIVCNGGSRWSITQVGRKSRKVLGNFGATFCKNDGNSKELVVYASRPGLHLWLADKNGLVQQTLIYKSSMMSGQSDVHLINPAPSRLTHEQVEHTFGPLLVFKDRLLVTYSCGMVYVLDPSDICVVATVAHLRHVLDVSVTEDEIFILEGSRNIIRVAYSPDPLLAHNIDNAGDTWIDPLCDQLSLDEVFLYIVGRPEFLKKIVPVCTKEDPVWIDVAIELKKLGLPLGEHGALKCARRWNSMVTSYNVFKKTKKWNGQSNFPSYFGMLEKILTKAGNNSSEGDKVQVISVATGDQSPPHEYHPKRIKVPCDEVINLDSFLNLPAHRTDHIEDSAISEVSDNANLRQDECESVYYDEHVTVYPEAGTPSLSENASFPSSDVEGNHGVFIIVTPSFVNVPEFSEDSAAEEPEILKEYWCPVEESVDVVLQEEDCVPDEMAEEENGPPGRKRDHPPRPVPTPAQALMAVSSHAYNAEKARDQMRIKSMERKFQQTEATIFERSAAIQELSERAIDLFSCF